MSEPYDLRPRNRLNYRTLDSTGEKVSLETEIDNICNNLVQNLSIDENMSINQLLKDDAIISTEIEDFLDEKSIEEIPMNEKIYDNVLDQIGDLRSKYRNLHVEIKSNMQDYDEKFGKSFAIMMNSIKCYIKSVNYKKRELYSNAEDIKVSDDWRASRTFQHYVDQIQLMMDDAHKILNVNLSHESDKEILKRKDDQHKLSKQVRQVGEKLEEIIRTSSHACEQQVEDINTRYRELITQKDDYLEQLNKLAKEREVEKKESFEASKLNIKIQKFKGYDSSIDIYSFQDLFEKLFLKEIPTDMLPDYLKNNYLEGSALSHVKHVDDIAEIWIRLKAAFGDSKVMLTKKLAEFSKMDALWRLKDSSKIAEGLTKIINCMKDLIRIAKRHNIENHLFYGNSIDAIYKIIGDKRVTRWLAIMCDRGENWGREEVWLNLIDFLEKDVKVNQQKALIGNTNDKKSTSKDSSTRNFHASASTTTVTTCFICGDDDHVPSNGPNGSKIIQYFSCKKFVDMTPAERFAELLKKGLCFQCLYPGAKKNSGKHKDGKCQKNFTCKDSVHDQYPRSMHVLVCDAHKDNQENKDTLQNFVQKFIMRQPDLPVYSKNIRLSFHSSRSNVDESAIYMLQPISINGINFTIFYDSGCGDFVSRYDAVKKLRKRAVKEFDGPITLGGVGGIVTETKHGIYSIRLPLMNGKDALMTGVCLDEITKEFPSYPLHGNVLRDIEKGYLHTGGDINDLPRIPAQVGGKVDFMIGIKYLRYFPDVIFQLPSGLTIYRSKFRNADGSCGVIGGPHCVFTDIENQYHISSPATFLTNQLKLFQNGFQTDLDVGRLSSKDDYQQDIVFEDTNLKELHDASMLNDESTLNNVMVMRNLKLFESYEMAGSEILYRCVNCRDCKDCKRKDGELLSIREEVEQSCIEKSITIDTERRTITAQLPFTHEPSLKLQPNRHKALKVFEQQMKKLNRDESSKSEVLQSEMKLHTLGYVDFVRNLPPDVQSNLATNKIQNYIPWRAVWKESSISTPCRMVFDASQPTDSGYSLNDILCKGRNNMNKLVEVFIRWRSHKIAFHTDVAKMYNSVKLDSEHWCYQRYLWKEGLNYDSPLEEKVIKTLIYGVKSSGNQAESGLRKVAELSRHEYPEIYEVVMNDIYVDDCLSGEANLDVAMERSDQLHVVLNRGGFRLKGITTSGEHPHKDLSFDGKSINVAGLVWEPKDDIIYLDVKELNFAKKCRGKTVKVIADVPLKLTRRQCTSKVAAIYDLTGMFTPVIAAMKLDLHELVSRQLNWDDQIPDNLRNVWLNHFEMMSEINSVQFRRAIIPEDAVSLDVNTLAFGDASKDLVCVAIYARYQRSNGEHSCQLVFGRSRLVPDNMSQPRAELYAALVNTHSSEVVKRAFYLHHTYTVMFTDSQIALHWICNENKTLKQWVRNRVIEIRRYSEIQDWRYVQSDDMVADIGTRRGVSVNEIKADSTWINGYKWMTAEVNEFPALTVDEVKLNSSELNEASKESNFDFTANAFLKRYVPDEVEQRYHYSKFLLDPNRHRFKVIIRIMAYVIKFVRILQGRILHKTAYQRFPSVILDEVDLQAAQKYYFRKATCEIKHFMKKNEYEKFSKEIDGILLYTGRILPDEEITITGRYTLAMKDLSKDTFMVPIVEKFSPLAYSIVNEIHWYDDDVKHSGVETTWRYVLKHVYIIEGRNIVKKTKKSCQRCRFLEKRRIEVAMGSVSPCNLCVAPAFYNTQTDLCGPFEAYSYQHKRTTIKIWFAIFCCATTSAVDIKVMSDYSTSAFIMAFIRFSCTFGYPKLMLSDEGSQIVKAFESMQLRFIDIQQRLYHDGGVQYEICPVGGHNMNGKVERKIREIRSSLEKRMNTNRLSILQWETLCYEIANSINNLPLALGSIVSDFESMDLLTPNRLLLGRNNDRCPSGNMIVTSDPKKIFKANNAIFDSWFENWLLNHVPKLMEQPKWFKTEDIKEGDIVLFLKNDSSLSSTYQYGIVHSTEISKDGKIRKVEVKYKNSSEDAFRYTYRAVRELIVIHHIDEIGMLEELAGIAC